MNKLIGTHTHTHTHSPTHTSTHSNTKTYKHVFHIETPFQIPALITSILKALVDISSKWKL